MNDVQLSKLLDSTGADGAIIVNSKGELVKSMSIDSAENIAAMLGVLVKMCKDFSEDLTIGKFRQIVLKSDDGIFLADKIYKEDAIVGVYSKDVTKGGLMKIFLDKINNK